MTERVTTERRVTWAELFFDLVFVFAITQLSALLHTDHSWAGVGRVFVVFLPVYWAWVGTSMQMNQRPEDRPGDRISLFAVALCGLLMALALPDAYGERGLLFAGAYWLARLVFGLVVFGRHLRQVNPFTVSMFFTGPLLVAGALLGGPAREVVWLVGGLLDLAMPSIQRKRLGQMHFDAGHLTERFGLFVLIALGESIVAIGEPVARSGESVDAATLVAVVAAFVLTCGLWWVYFHFANAAMRYALETAAVQLSITRHVLSYGHVLFIGSIVAIAVGLEETVAQPTARLGWGVLGLLFGGTAVFLAAFGYTRWAMFHLVSSTRITAAVVAVALLPVAHLLPALAASALLAATVIVLNLVEMRRVRREADEAV